MLKTGAGDVIGTNVLDDRDIIYTRAEAAKYLRKSVPTLERWAKLGIGPKPIKLGGHLCFYTLRSLRAEIGDDKAA